MADPKKESHKKRKRKRNDPVPGTSTPTPASSNNAVVTEEKTKKPKKMAGRSPAQVCRQINELKLGNDKIIGPSSW